MELEAESSTEPEAEGKTSSKEDIAIISTKQTAKSWGLSKAHCNREKTSEAGYPGGIQGRREGKSFDRRDCVG